MHTAFHGESEFADENIQILQGNIKFHAFQIVEVFNIKQVRFFMTTRRISMIPGSEPILLDLEKLFLLSGSLGNQCVQPKIQILRPKQIQQNNKNYKSGHSSEPRCRIWSKIDGEASYKPPGAF